MAGNKIGDLKVGIGVESTVDQDLQKAENSLKKFAQEAGKTGQATQQGMSTANEAIESVGVTSEKTEKKNTRAVNAMMRSVKRFTSETRADYADWAAAQAGITNQTEGLRAELRQVEQAKMQAASAGQQFVKQLQDEITTLGMNRRELLEYRAAQLGVATQTQPLINKMFDTSKAFTSAEMSFKQTRQAMRMLPAQITDVVTSLASGMPIYLVAIQQGGQLRDSFGGFGNMLKGVLALINPMVFAIGSLAAVGGLAYYSYERVAGVLRSFEKTLITSGNSAGVTSSQMQSMAMSVSESTGSFVSVGNAVNKAIGSIDLVGQSYATVASAAVMWSEATGESVEDVVAQFASLAKDPLSAMEKLDKQYNFLTVSAYEQVTALIQQGNQTEASRILIDELANTIEQRTPEMIEQTNFFARSVSHLKNGFFDLSEAVAGFFTAASAQDQYNTALEEHFRLAELQIAYANDPSVLQSIEEQIEKNNELLASQNQILVVGTLNAEANKALISQKELLNQEDDIRTKNLTKQQILEQQSVALTEMLTLALKDQNLEHATRNSMLRAFAYIMEENVKQSLEEVKVTKEAKSSARDLNAEIMKQIDNYQFETEAMMMNNFEKERATFLRDLENKGIREGSVAWKEYLIAFDAAQAVRIDTRGRIDSLAQEKKAMEDLTKERVKQEESFAKQVQKINDQIGQSLTDALVNGGQSAKDLITNMFKTLILRPLLQPIISGTLGALGLGASGAAFAGMEGVAGGGGGMDFMGLASTLKDGYTMLSTGFASVGIAASEMAASFTYGTSLMSQQTAMLAAQEAGMATTVGAVGAAATVLAGVAAGIGAGTFISGQYALGGDQIISTGLGTAIGTGIGFAVGGPIGAAIGAFLGGAAGGLVNRAFGQGPKQTQNAGLTGTIGMGDTNLSSFTDWKRSGGWFSSGSRGRNMGGVDQGIVDYFNQTLSLVGGSVAVMARSIGLSTDQIAGYTQQIELSLLGLTQVQAQEKLQEAINNFTNGLIVKSLPVIMRYQKASESATDTLTRLSQSLATANQIFKAMDMSVYGLSIESADSASKLIDLTGGIDSFLGKMDFVYQNFFTNQERVDNAVNNLSETFAMLGLTMPDTREQFKQLITVIQAAGSNTLLAALLEIAPAFDSVTTALESEAVAAAQIAQNILSERIAFETKISQALGDIATIRQRELASLDESNRGLAMALYALADAQDALQISTDQTDKAFSDLQVALETRLNTTLKQLQTEFDALTASLDAQVKAAMEAESAAQNNINSLKSVFTYLQEQINDLTGLGNTTYSFAQAMAYLAQAEANMLGGRGAPDQAQLSSAVSGARAGLADTSMFGSSFEQQRATGLLVAQLTRLKDATANQLSIEEKQLIVAQEQLRSLYSAYDQATIQYAADQQAAQDAYGNDLALAKNQIDALRGIDNSVFSVEQAIDRLNVATLSERDRILTLQEMMVSLQQDANARAQAEADRIEAERQAVIKAELARVEALRQAQLRAEQQVAAERAAEAERIAAQQRAAAAAEAARQAAAAAAAEAERRRREAADDAFYQWQMGKIFGYDSGTSVETSSPEFGWGGSQNADGGMFQGGISLVGEEGPELVNFARPSMIYTAGETADILNGGSEVSETAYEIRQLRQENQAQSRAMVSLQSRMTRLIEQWDGDGLPTERYEGATP